MGDLNNKIMMFTEDYLTSSMLAIVLLIVGFFAIILVTKMFRKSLLSFFKVNHFFAKLTGRTQPLFDLEVLAARILFFGLLLYLFYACAQVAGIEGLVYLFSDILTWLNKVLTIVLNAVIPITFALIFAYLARNGAKWLGEKFKLDQRVGSHMDAGEAVSFSLTKSLSEISYGLVFLYFLPEILRGIGLDKLSNPITNMFEEVVSFLPRLLVAALIVFLGWFVARLIRQTIEGLMVSLGIDAASKKILGDNALGNIKLSKIIPAVLYVVILMLAAVQAMEKLRLERITAPLQDLIQNTFNWIPSLLFALALLFGAVYVGGIVGTFITQILKEMGFDNIYAKLGLGDIKTGAKTPSDIVGFLAMATIVVMALLQALETLKLKGLYDILNTLIEQFGNIVVGVIVFGIGLFVAKTVSEWIESGVKTGYANLLSLMSRVVIIVITGAMALQQIGIADEIVTIAFALAMGSIALGVAIAIGLGAKEPAEEIAKEFVAKFRSGFQKDNKDKNFDGL